MQVVGEDRDLSELESSSSRTQIAQKQASIECHTRSGGKFASEKVKRLTRQINTMASKEREVALNPVRQAQWTVKAVEGQKRGDPTPKLSLRNGASAIHTQVVAHVVKTPYLKDSNHRQNNSETRYDIGIQIGC